MGPVIGAVLAVVLFIVWLLVTLTRDAGGGNTAAGPARDALRGFAANSLELESVQDILAYGRDAAAAIFGCQRVVAFETGAESGSWEASVPGQEALGAVPAAMRGLFGWVKHNTSIAAEADLGQARFGAMRGPFRQIMERYKVDVVLPLVDRGQVLAVLGVQLGRKPTRVDRELMRLFRLQATAACANVRLHREAAHMISLAQEVDLAGAVQLALVPEAMDGGVKSVSWAGDVQAAGDAGSDFWAVYPLADDRVVMIVGDAVGRGLAGSMVSAVVKSCSDAIFDTNPTRIDPSILLAALNRALYRSQNPVHTSCFAIIFDPAKGLVQYANAGHDIPYHLTFGDTAAKLGVLAGSGPLLGDSVDATYKLNELSITGDHAFVLFTDGLVKVKNAAGKEYGERTLQKLLKATEKPVPKSLRRSILKAVGAHSEGVQLEDDTLVVVVRFTNE
jgi:serine phosphatase RsbU (regulator of sigma subunit)